MASYNRVVLVGNLTRDIELRYIPSGMAVAEIGLAINDRRKNASGEWVEEATFVDVTLWGRTAEVASEYLSKGSSILVEGRLKLDRWETDGQKRSKLRVVGEKMQMLGGGGGGGRSGGGSHTASRPATTAAGKVTAADRAIAGAEVRSGGQSSQRPLGILRPPELVMHNQPVAEPATKIQTSPFNHESFTTVKATNEDHSGSFETRRNPNCLEHSDVTQRPNSQTPLQTSSQRRKRRNPTCC